MEYPSNITTLLTDPIINILGVVSYDGHHPLSPYHKGKEPEEERFGGGTKDE